MKKQKIINYAFCTYCRQKFTQEPMLFVSSDQRKFSHNEMYICGDCLLAAFISISKRKKKLKRLKEAK